VCQSLLLTPLSEAQTLKLSAVSALCAWCGNSGASCGDIKMRPETDLKHLRNKLVGLLNDDKFDVKRSFDLQMVTVLTTFILVNLRYHDHKTTSLVYFY